MSEVLDGIIINGEEYEFQSLPNNFITGDHIYEGDNVQYKTNDDEYIGHIDNDGIHAKNFFVRQNNQEVNIKDLIGASVDISLPDKIYAVVGDTLQLFYRGIIKLPNPYSVDILILCSKGKQYPRYFEYTPTITDVGTTTFIIHVKNTKGQIINEKQCFLITVKEPISPISPLHILCFGDSLTSGGVWCAEAYRRLTQSDGTPVGKNLSNIIFSGSKTNGGAGYFGMGGWHWGDYVTSGREAIRLYVTGVSNLRIGAVYTDDKQTYTIQEINVTEGVGNILCGIPYRSTIKPESSGSMRKQSGEGDTIITFTSYEDASQNPLWDYSENKMTFIPYVNRYCGGQIDVVYTLLSWNHQFPFKTDFTEEIAWIKIFADTLHREYPNAKLKIMGIQVQSVNGGLGASYGASGSLNDTFGHTVIVMNQNTAFQDFANQNEYKDFVEFVNISSQFDSEYNMPQTQKDVNSRNSLKEYIGTNGVHPSVNGYYQIADVVYRNIVANFCQ